MSYIKLSKSAFFHNLQQIESVTDRSKIAVVLKDNAYGHGLLEMAKLSKEYGIKKAVVRTAEEAKQIKDFFQFILILSDIPKTTEENFHITINSLEDIEKVPERSNVQLKVDSGMHRNGIELENLEKAIHLIQSKQLALTGVFSHSRSSDELSTEAFWQLKNFEKIKNKTLKILKNLDLPTPMFHLANSATTYRLGEEASFDMVRIGIGIYGYSENDETIGSFDLQPVMSLWGEKISSRVLQKNTKVGYGGVFEAKEDTKISTYDIGYADGFFRLNEAHNHITPNGSRILGRVSMDSMSLDCEEDEICIFNDCTSLAKQLNTITYEILVKLSYKINRLID
ncbi:MAG: alanine racemase [Campylobacterales bacterium]|nr:alanine racemase [Campylobacterales bacterium]